MTKRICAQGGCLGGRRRRRTGKSAISLGELIISFDPGISEWENPTVFIQLSITEYIGNLKRTQGTETSKYLEEKKSTEIP